MHAFFTEMSRLMLALLCAHMRIHAMFAILPLFSRQVMPTLTRTGIGVAMSLPVLPQVLAGIGNESGPRIAAALLKETVIGMMMGYAVAVLFWGIEAIGFFIDNQRGASISSTLDPLTGSDSSPLGIMFNQAFMVYFMVAGGFLVMLGTVYDSYRIWPVLSFFPTLLPGGTTVFAHLFERVSQLALLLAAPVIVVMLVAELGLGLVSRFAPQLQVFFLAMPIKSALAFVVLAVYLPTLLGYFHDDMGALVSLIDTMGRVWK